MNIKRLLPKLFSSNRARQSQMNTTRNVSCIADIEIKEMEFFILSLCYVEDKQTSYRPIVRKVFDNNLIKFRKIMKSVREQITNGCTDENIMVTFTYRHHKLQIPFDVFSKKRSTKQSYIRSKKWHRENIQTISRIYPEIGNTDE